MDEPIAFGGDDRLREMLLERLARYGTADRLRIGPTFWDGTAGTALGLSIEGEDPRVYVERFGYPLPLAALLDPLITLIATPALAAEFARRWVADVAVGAKLRTVPTRLMLYMLDHVALADDHDGYGSRLRAMHEREIAGLTVEAEQWSALRRDLLAGPEPQGRRAALRARMWEAAAWPASRGRSVLVGALGVWKTLAVLEPDPDWSDEDELRKDEILASLWGMHGAKGDETVNYHALFKRRDPDRAARFLANLERTNRRVPLRVIDLANRLASFMAAAPSEVCTTTPRAGSNKK